MKKKCTRPYLQAILGPYNNHDHHTLCCASLAAGDRKSVANADSASMHRTLKLFTRLQKMRSDGNYK